MKVVRMILLFAVAIAFIFLCGCSGNESGIKEVGDRIECLYSGETENIFGQQYIILDKSTGVLYLVTRGQTSGGMGVTVMVDKNCKPLVDMVGIENE